MYLFNTKKLNFKIIAFLAFILSFGNLLYSQGLDGKVPIVVHRNLVAGIGIPGLKLKNHPERDYYQKRIYRGEELTVFILSSETAENTFDSFPLEEFVLFLNGKATVEPEGEGEHSFYPNDYIIVPKGFKGKWTNVGGPKYHLELSVISNKRTDSTIYSEATMPFTLDKDILAGIKQQTEFCREVFKGIEISVIACSERPSEKEVTIDKEKFITLLSGKLTLTSQDGTIIEFYRGDSFILPNGFSGKWEGDGPGSLRYLVVRQTKN